MKGFEHKSYVGLKTTLYSARAYPLRITEVKMIDSTLILPVNAPEAHPLPTKPAAPVIDQPLVSK